MMELFELASGKPLSQEEEGSARRIQLVIRATLASVVFAALYGLAAGSTDLALALGNLYKMPMVILLSTACALPVGLLTWKMTGAQNRASDLLIAVASGNFTATLVLASLAPIVALYYHTSGYMGGALALGVATFALLIGLYSAIRAVLSRIPVGVTRRSAALPMVVLLGAQVASLVQFIHVASPILPEITVFDGGMDAIIDGHGGL